MMMDDTILELNLYQVTESGELVRKKELDAGDLEFAIRRLKLYKRQLDGEFNHGNGTVDMAVGDMSIADFLDFFGEKSDKVFARVKELNNK